MKLDPNTLNKVLEWIAIGFFAGAGVGLWQLVARSVDFLKPLGW